MPRHAIYQQNRVEFSEAERARRVARQPRVSPQELDRLRLTENRLESLRYDAEAKCVCLNCGLICDNLSRHVSACPEKKQSSNQYSEQWGFARSTTLASAGWQASASRTKKGSPRFQRAQEQNRKGWQAASDAQRRLVSEAKKSGQPIRRGPLRAQAKLSRHGRGLTRRLRRPEVTDAQIEKILALDLTIAESARRVGLSQTAFYRRAQRRHGWTAKDAKAKRALITKYVFDLRPWLRSCEPIPTVQQIIQRHMRGLRSTAGELFQEFRPFLSHLEAELNDKPGLVQDLASRRDSAAVITLASRVFQRARMVIAKPRSRGLAEDTKNRIVLAAACHFRGWSKRKMSGLVFHGSDDAYDRTKELFRRHGKRIEEAESRMNVAAADSLISNAKQ
jgi:AraC-like DNA-binding protein